MRKHVLFDTFLMNCIHQSQRLWIRPDDSVKNQSDLETWMELHEQSVLRQGCFAQK